MNKNILEVSTKNEIILEKLGNRIKEARLRRNIRAEILAENAGISRGTLFAIERGSSTTAIGAYVAVLCVLGLENDISYIARDEGGKEQYPESRVFRRERAGRKKE